jgi:starch synthase
VHVYEPDARLRGANQAVSTLSADLMMADAAKGASVVHSHTWYTGMAGHLASLLYGVPHVLTAHSLEPLRPWKAEQLGGGYRVSSWVEQTAVLAADAVIAVSTAMREDVLRVYPTLDPSAVHVIRNGVDTGVWYPAGPVRTGSMLSELGVDPGRPIVVFVGRITRQKGLAHLVAAAHRFSPEAQVVLCAGAPDTPDIAAEIRDSVAALAASRTGVFWIREMLPIGDLREILSAASVFVCPSVYEPLGIVNLEAMACSTAVVASDVGGIPEVVADGVTGTLVHYGPDDPRDYQAGLADAVNELIADREKAQRYGEAGRQRCVEEFSWAHVAEQTAEIYRKVCA